jgi:tol-pal system protein YbgF
MTFKRTTLTAIVLAWASCTSSPLYAQESPDLMVDIMNRLNAVEAENRDLRGQIEEVRHEVTGLKQRMETLNADVDYRLSNPDSGGSGAPLTPPKEGAVPLGGGDAKETSPAPGGNGAEEYERARALLEQGDYEAAERAFAAFVAAHPKDENAAAAQYWLGVTFFVRNQYDKAVAAFAKGYKVYPKSKKAPDMLFKLAKSLAALERKADACTTLDQLSSDFPKAHAKEVSADRKTLGCK